MKPYQVIITSLSSALLISVLASILFFVRGRQYYLQLNATRLDPLGLSYYTTPPKPAATRQTRVVFLGDSRAHDWTFPTGLDQCQFINRGIGAQTSAQVLARFENHVEPLQPHIVIIQVGINDLKTIPLFPNQKSSIIANCQDNIAQLVSRSLDLDATVVVTTIFPLGQIPLERRPFWSPDVAAAIKETNAFIHTLQTEKVIILDTAAALAGEHSTVKGEYSRDFLHLDAAGYDALNEKLVPILAELVPRPPNE